MDGDLQGGLPEVQRLDCAFDFRDTKLNNMGIFLQTCLELDFSDGSDDDNDEDEVKFKVDRLSQAQRWERLHACGIESLETIWLERLELCLEYERDLLRLDISSCRCAHGRCRLGVKMVLLLHEDADTEDRPARYPRNIEIVGALNSERKETETIFLNCKKVSMENVTFTNERGCQCEVSLSIMRNRRFASMS